MQAGQITLKHRYELLTSLVLRTLTKVVFRCVCVGVCVCEREREGESERERERERERITD